MNRIYADNQQTIRLARHMLSINELDAKAYLEPRGYQGKINGVVYNFDYRMVQLAIDIYKSVYKRVRK